MHFLFLNFVFVVFIVYIVFIYLFVIILMLIINLICKLLRFELIATMFIQFTINLFFKFRI